MKRLVDDTLRFLMSVGSHPTREIFEIFEFVFGTSLSSTMLAGVMSIVFGVFNLACFVLGLLEILNLLN